jgi:NAD(P)-dependent dehydrogenase (short-subunit alcohol dehydrogenase family)
MQLHLSGQTVAVVGAANGIGRAIAEGFLAEGCRVHGFDRDAAPVPLRQPGDIRTGDATSYEQIKAFAAGCGDVDHVVFAVGAGSGKFGFPFWNLEPGDWARVLDINLVSAVNVAHAFAPAMARRARGTLLFLTSVAGQVGSPTDPPYSAAKAGLINFMQCAARDLAAHGVRANALAPGMVRTALNQSVWAAGQKLLPAEKRQDYTTWAEEKIRKIAPLGRWQEPAEFAALAVFLASDHARNITGQTLNVDGGQVMHA